MSPLTKDERNIQPSSKKEIPVTQQLRLFCQCGQPSINGTPIPKPCIMCKGIAEIERLQRELWTVAECIFQNVSSDDAKHWARGIRVSIRNDEPPSFAVETHGKRLHDEECDNCGEPWSQHLTNKLICPDAAIADAYRFRQAFAVNGEGS